MASEVNRVLSRAAYRGDVAGIAAALLAGADPNAVVDHCTQLQTGALSGNVVAIAALLAAGARVNGTSSHGWTPLMYAASNGQTSTVDALLSAGADVRHADIFGRTALHYASMYGRLDVAGLLVDAGARADVPSKEGKRSIDQVRAWLARARQLAAPLRHCAQVRARDEATKAALRALFASAAPWSRRRPVALACYGVEWEWEA
jgi:hypothetical protein